jgi:hypothetical protein
MQVLWELWLVSATLGADKLHLMGGFLKGPDLVQKLKDLDISSASFTTNLSDKALLMASIEGAGHLPTFSASIRELLLEAARAAAISMEAASAAADEAARTAAAAAAEEAVKQEASSAGAGPTPTTSAADAKAAAEAAKQQAQDVQLDYALAVYRAAAVLEACGLQQGMSPYSTPYLAAMTGRHGSLIRPNSYWLALLALQRPMTCTVQHWISAMRSWVESMQQWSAIPS